MSDSKTNLDNLMKTHIIEMLKKILSISPDSFNNIKNAVREITKDGTISAKDIPQFIIVVQKLYQIIYSLKDAKLDSKHRVEYTAEILKYIVRLLLIERKITIEEDKETQFLAEYDALIDSYIGLLSFHKSIKPKKCLKLFH